MIEHWRMKKHLADYLDGGLSLRQRDRFERHLARCAVCRRDAEGMKGLLKRLKNDPVPMPSPEVWEGLPLKIREALGREEEERPVRGVEAELKFRPFWPAPSTAIFAVLVAAAFLLIRWGGGSVDDELRWSSADPEVIVAELAGMDQATLDGVIGFDGQGPQAWMESLGAADEEDLEAFNADLNLSEDEFWTETDLIDAVIGEATL